MRTCLTAILLCAICGSVFAQQSGTTYGDRYVLTATGCTIRSGSGSPESAVVGSVCDVYIRSDASASNTAIYLKLSGTATNTGWIAVPQASLTTLAAFAATTSAQLAGVLSDETGTGLAVFDTAPTLASTLTVGAAATYDPIVISPGAKGGTSYSGTLTSTGDLSAARTYELPDYSGIAWITGERFARPHLLVSTDWSKTIGKGDGATNYVIGSAMGPVCWREEQDKTTSSWKETVNGLDLSADDTTDNEGVEIYFAGINETLGNGWIVTGTTGGCFEVTFTNTNISATDQFVIGWRKTEAFNGDNDYTAYSDWSVVGVTANDGSVFSQGEVGGAGTQSDDSGTDIADGSTHTLKSCINASTRVPTAYLDGTAITLTNSGAAKTNAIAMAPFVSYLHGSESADAGILITRWSIIR